MITTGKLLKVTKSPRVDITLYDHTPFKLSMTFINSYNQFYDF